MNTADFKKLLEDIRRKKEAAKQSPVEVAKLLAKVEEAHPETIDISKLGVDEENQEEVAEVISSILEPEADAHIPGVARDVVLNKEQQAFLDLAVSGRSCCLIGAAGTGKTTTMRQVTRQLLDSGYLPALHMGTKYLKPGSPGMVIVSFTNKAVNNIRHAVVDELKPNTITIHKLLQFVPVFYDIEDPANPGILKKTVRFEPTYTKLNTLPSSIKTIAFEESSMVGVDLYGLLQDAMDFPHQEIFLGDIQQLPPVFGPAILGFKLNTLPVVELTQIYRQAANSPIIDLAWKLLRGEAEAFSPKAVMRQETHPITKQKVSRRRVPALEVLSRDTEFGSVLFQPWQKPLDPDHALHSFCKQIEVWYNNEYYDPEQDIILCPYNQAFGTLEINKNIAQFLGLQRGAVVHHVIAGFMSHYLAVGDRVLYNKEDAIITDIRRNPAYIGKHPTPPSNTLDRWGNYREKLTKAEEYFHKQESDNMEEEAFELMMNSPVDEEVTERKNQSSHIIEIKFAYNDDPDVETFALTTAGEVNSLLGGYAITVHKAQGSEWRKVFLVLHSQHVKMVSRELLYTAVTRARQQLHIICEPDTFFKGVKSQRISGDTLQQKAALFRGKALAPGMVVPVTEALPEVLIGKKVARPYLPAHMRIKATEDLDIEEAELQEAEEKETEVEPAMPEKLPVPAPAVKETLAEKLARLKAQIRK